ncbi:MAG: DUF1549 domain-containing protein, partial [Phycisphaerales bacterium]
MIVGLSIVPTLVLAAPAGEVDFTRDIAPLLAARCYQCHGPDASSRKAGLRLDRRDAATRADAEGVAAIVPGRPDESELLARVTSADPDERMPPSDGHAPLSPAEVDALRAWIAAGAPYEKHWSWRPLPAVDPAELNMPASLAQALDRPADPLVWLRRVHFDLIGLPPTPEECASFLSDIERAGAPRAGIVADSTAPAPDSYAARIDALLASPRFGERWGRHWLDLVRYAETHGHEFDYPIDEAWRYRDWVIRALNADLTYADFVREQVAGDLLSSPRINPEDGTSESIVATGWWWLSQGTHAPVDVRLDQAERIDNQIDVATKAFLGTTASCARCHDHKFDDVSQRDYYALFGVVRSSRRVYAYEDPKGAIRHAVESLAAASGGSTDAPESALAPTPPPPTPPEPPSATWTFAAGSLDGWTASGWAFDDSPRPNGILHSATRALALHGTVRSPTFTVPELPIHIRCRGAKSRVRLIIDGYFLDERNPLLFDGFIHGVDHPDEWRTVALDAHRYAGEPAYLEIADDGDGFIAIDWVALGDVPDSALAPSTVPPIALPPTPGVTVPAPIRVLAMEAGTGMDTPLYVRGNARAPGDTVPRGMIAGLRTATDSP